MFVPLADPLPTLRPRNSLITQNDWDVLARYWYPVAIEGDVKDAPLKGRILDVELAIYRTAGGITVAHDLCPHRNVRISAGFVADDRIVCPFHGLAFDGAGQCIKVPCLGRDAKLPNSYRLQVFRSEIRYGMVWACLDDTSPEQVPVFRAAHDAGVEHLHFSKPYDWPVGAPHQVENYLDIAHLPFIHEKTIGGDQNFAPPPPRSEKTDDGIVIYATSHHAGEDGKVGLYEYISTIHLPFAVETVGRPAEGSEVSLYAYKMWNVAVPTSAHECRVFWVSLLDEPSPIRESQEPPLGGNIIRAEDLAVLTELARPDFPLDEKRQIHLPVDKISNDFRQSLREIGLGRS